MKYTAAYPNKPFSSLADARAWVHSFVEWYNEEHRHSGIRFVTPGQRHRGDDATILANRKAVYEQAKAEKPERWTADTRNWEPVCEVWLNPSNELREQEMLSSAV